MSARRVRMFVGIAVTLGVLTCGDIDKLTIEETSSTTIQGASLLEQLVGDLGFGGFLNMDISQNQELKNQGVKREQIDSVHIQSLTLTITDDPADDRDFTFIGDLKFFVESDGLERKLIASGGPFDAGLTTVGLDVEDVDLAPYATAQSMSITTEVNGRRPSEDTTVKGKIVLVVDVDVSGAVCGGS